MSKIKPWKVIILGVLIFVAAFIFDLLFAGIPYQDVEQEILDRWNRNNAIAKTGYGIGFIVFGVGVILSFVKLMANKFQSRN